MNIERVHVSALPSNKGMEPTAEIVTPFAAAKAVPISSAAHARSSADGESPAPMSTPEVIIRSARPEDYAQVSRLYDSLDALHHQRAPWMFKTPEAQPSPIFGGCHLFSLDRLENEQAWLAWHCQRWALRQQHSWPLLAEFRKWLQATEQTVLPKSPVGQALQYVLPRWDGLVRYCENGALSIDNNLSERSVRPVAIGRKN